MPVGFAPDVAGGDLGSSDVRLPAGVEEPVSLTESCCGWVPHPSSIVAEVVSEGHAVDPPALGREPVTHGRSRPVFFVLGTRLGAARVPLPQDFCRRRLRLNCMVRGCSIYVQGLAANLGENLTDKNHFLPRSTPLCSEQSTVASSCSSLGTRNVRDASWSQEYQRSLSAGPMLRKQHV